MSNTRVRLDDRAGSRELYTALLAVGLHVDLTRLPFGDIEFEGRGPEGAPVLIGIEHKQVSDVVHCIQDGRFAGHQLPGMLGRFDYSILLVEGVWRAGAGGSLQVLIGTRYCDQKFGGRDFRYSELHSWLTTMEFKSGIKVHRVPDQQSAAQDIAGLVRWWTSKDFADHRGHLAFDPVADSCKAAILVRPTLVRAVAKELPGVGWERSLAISRRFSSVVDMVAATEEEWTSIEGIGATTARRIMRELGSDALWKR